MLHYRLAHVFRPVLLSWVYPVVVKAGSGKNYVPANSTCAPGNACLHLSNHRHTPFGGTAAGGEGGASGIGCTVQVRGFAHGAVLHSVPVATPPAGIGPVAGKPLPQAHLLATRCSASLRPCYLNTENSGAPSMSISTERFVERSFDRGCPTDPVMGLDCCDVLHRSCAHVESRIYEEECNNLELFCRLTRFMWKTKHSHT
jgi:hypothetical protein